jgi:mannan endo-1,4-beta-mannosidase
VIRNFLVPSLAALVLQTSACTGELLPKGPGPCLACDSIYEAGSVGRAELLERLHGIMESNTFIFGQQRFNLTGVNPDGSQWLASADDLDRSDVKSLVGSHPGVLGIDVWDLAIKPGDWVPTPAQHAQAIVDVAARGGVINLEWHMRGCDASDLDGRGFYAAGNETCLCRLANDDPTATAWLERKLDRLADAVEEHGLRDIPMIFRPMHEFTGNWFWWGYGYWDCDARVAGATVRGPEAYKKVFRKMVDHLRVERGLDSLLIAYSPDKLWEGIGDTEEERFLSGYPGDAYVDVMGIDLYYLADRDFDEQTERYGRYLELVTGLARQHGKVAALTETGNYRLALETSAGESRWYSDHLLPLIKDNPKVALAYVLVWENRRNAKDEFYVPYPGHAGVDDFLAFARDEATLFLDDLGGTGGPDTPPDEYPTCQWCSSATGDGWGWEDERSCRVPPWCD